MNIQRIDGPRLTPLNGGPAKQLVVLLHGFAADGGDIVGLGKQWQRMLPDAAFAAPTALEFCTQPPMGHQWFDPSSPNPDDHWKGVEAAASIVDAFVDGELANLGLDDSALALAGFSQGAIMALHVGLRRNPGPVAIVSFSGTLIGVDQLETDARARPAVLLCHGEEDQIIPVEAVQYTQTALMQVGVRTEAHVAEGMAHDIDGESTWRAGGFLRDAFGFQAPQEFIIG